LHSPSGRSKVNLDLPASDIGITVTSLSTKSNSLHGDERIVLENGAKMIWYHTWFLNPFVKPAGKKYTSEGLLGKGSYQVRLEKYIDEKGGNDLCKSCNQQITSHLRLCTANLI